MKTPIKSLLGVLALAALPVALEAQSRPTFIGSPNLVRGEQPELNATSDATLARIAMLAERGDDWKAIAENAGLRVLRDMVLVEVTAKVESGGYVRTRTIDSLIKEVGGLPVGNGRAYIDPAVLPDLESKLTSNSSWARISAYRAPVANSYGHFATEGESAMKTNLYNLNGEGVTIALMDIGFDGLTESESGKVERRPYDSGANDASSHGTAMVEVIRDIAPGAKLLAYRIDEHLDIHAATLDAINSGADVIVSALSYFDLPGRSAADDAARLASDNGLRWVNAAGNFADGRYSEMEGAGVVDVSGQSFVSFGLDDPYQFISDASDGIRIHLAQEEGAQLALELYSWDAMSSNLVLEAVGNHMQRVQTIVHPADPTKYYFPMVRVAVDGAMPRFRMFSETGQLFFSNAEGSIACPGGTGAVITVGAMDVQGYGPGAEPEAYSGRAGGIFELNLDLCGPTNCTTGIYGLQGFSGTSAAAAHVAGLVALNLTDKGLANLPLSGFTMAFVDDAEPDNDMDQATDLIAAGQDVSGRSLSPSGDQDWYSFEIEESMSADITITGDVGARLFLQAEATEAKLMALEGLNHIELKPGRYLLLVSGDFCQDYAVSLDLYQDAPQAVVGMSPETGVQIAVSADSDTHRIELAWKPVQGLGPISYQVQVVDGQDSRNILLDTVTEETSVKVGGLEAGREYIWRVRAMNDHGVSDFSADHTFMLVVKTESLKISDHDITDNVAMTPVGGSIETHSVPAPQGKETSSAEESAGCAGNTGSNGMIALLLAIVAAAALKQRKREKTKA